MKRRYSVISSPWFSLSKQTPDKQSYTFRKSVHFYAFIRLRGAHETAALIEIAGAQFNVQLSVLLNIRMSLSLIISVINYK